MSPLPRRRLSAVALALTCLLGAAATSGCSVGVDAETNLQGPSGNGAVADVDSLNARGLVLVLDPSGRANLIGTIVNVGNDADALAAVTVAGGTVAVSADGASTIPLPARTSVQFGYQPNRTITVSGLPPKYGQFVDVTLGFQTAGTVTTQVLTVPPAGIYTGLGPQRITVG